MKTLATVFGAVLFALVGAWAIHHLFAIIGQALASLPL